MNRINPLKFWILILLFLCARASATSPQSVKYTSNDRQVTYEIFGANETGPLLILLHGASGPGASLYREEAEFFAGHGYTVLLLHYFDATSSNAPSDKNYELWQRAVSDLIVEARKVPTFAARKICLIGFSLGASVALAAGSQKAPVAAIAEWYGSLPDIFFERRTGMPPLLILHGSQDSVIPDVNAQQLARLCQIEHYVCESHIYPGEGHGFAMGSLQDANDRTLRFFVRHAR
jgi:carboxymethylenebutenolidase